MRVIFWFIVFGWHVFQAAIAQDSLCAIVKIEIQQTLTLERQAFDARMAITNHLDTIPLEDVTINVNFTDDQGNSVLATNDPNVTNATFFIREDSMTGVNAVDGTGTIAPGAEAEIHWLIIPTQGAGGNIPSGKRYDVGATLTFTQNGEPQEIIVAPDLIFVRPLPDLTLDYFLTSDVVADDAFTPEIEPAEPFTLGVRVKNTGGGPANNLKIDTAQPEIIENEQGLLIDFTIISGQVNDEPTSPSLLINFGDIPPGEARIGRWEMVTTLSGQFTSFNAEFSHADELGGELTSLIDTINTHLLVKDVRVDLNGRDNVRDFLAKDIDVLRVYESDGADSDVLDQSAQASLSANGNDRYTLTFPTTPGFSYIQLDDPHNGAKTLTDVFRSDGKRVLLDNAWLSRSRVGGGPWDYHLNLFDANTAASYTLVFTDPNPGEQPPQLQFIPDRTTAIDTQVSFIVEASDPDGTIPTVTVDPLPNGASFLQQSSDPIATYVFDWTPTAGQNGRYEMTYTASDGNLTNSQTALIFVTSTNDTDGDGMDDAWELANFGTLDRDGTGDFDGDGISDLDEFLNGTDPTGGSGGGISITGNLTDAILGQAYSATLTASGGTTPYTFALLDPASNGQLPTGITLANDGSLSGTPSTLGVYPFTVQVTDANNATAEQAFNITVTGGTTQLMGDSGRLLLTDAPQTIILDHAYSHPVVFAQPLSANESDPAVVRISDVQADRFTLSIQEPANTNPHHSPEHVSWLVLEAGYWQLPDGGLLEVGTLTSDASVGLNLASPTWATVNFSAAFAAIPALLSQVQTANNAAFVKTRQSAATASNVLIALENSESASSAHGSETIGWLAIDPGFGNWDGYQYEALSSAATVTQSGQALSFSTAFLNPPRLLASISSYLDSDAAGLRQTEITTTSATLFIDEDTTADSEINHSAEQVDLITLEGTGLLSAADLNNAFNARPSARFTTSSGASAGTVNFDASAASDLDGNIVSYDWDFGDGNSDTTTTATTSHSYASAGVYSASLTVTDDLGATHTAQHAILVGTGTTVTMGESGQISDLDHTSQTITLSRAYNNPVVFAQPIELAGNDSTVVRITDVQADQFTLTIQEAPNLDGNSAPAAVSWVVLEAGIWHLPDGSRLDVGTLSTNATVGVNVATSQWQTVTFSAPFAQAPVVISQVQTNDDSHFVNTRQRVSTPSSVQLALQEDDAQTEAHGTETIGWLALSSGSGTWSGTPFLAGETGFAITDQASTVDFDPAFSDTPLLIAGLNSYAEQDHASVRIVPSTLSASSVQLQLIEETTQDGETLHTTESVAYLALAASGVLSAEPTDSSFNARPNAQFTATPLSGQAPLTVTVDASASSDDDGTIASYAWDFGEGNTGTGSTTSHTYSADGVYTITLTVTDNQGATDNVSATITVSSGGSTETTVTLQDGLNNYTGTRDTYLSSPQASTNFGSDIELRDINLSYQYHSLVRFAIFQSEGGPVPDGATIQSATLSLYKHSNHYYTYGAHRLLQDWDESEASWNERQAGVSWSVAGAADFGTDLALVADGEASISYDPGWLEFDVTSGLQAIGGGALNYGWRLVAISGYNSVAKRFRSREYADDATLRPKLTVVYDDSNITQPIVALTAPVEGASYVEGDTITLTASASDNGTITNVEFFANGTKLGETMTSPYSFAWTGATAGSYTLTAKATDDTGESATSGAITITVASGSSTHTLVLQDGLNSYAGTRDTYLSSPQATTNFGGDIELRDINLSYQYHSLVRFAIFQSEGGPVPDGATIQSATLSLYKHSNHYYTYGAHRLLQDWDESEASWNERQAGVSWSVAGAADFGTDLTLVADGEASISYDPGWLEFDVTSGLQAIGGGALNYGWRLVAISGYNSVAKRFRSREYADDATLRPKLTVVYDDSNITQPIVALTAPVEGASYVEGDTITLTASASDNGTITNVEFFANGTKLGETMTSPYSFAWTGATAGSYTLTAKATDDTGESATSGAITITVASGSSTSTLVLQDGLNNYTGTRDTYLSSPQASTNFGSDIELRDINLSYQYHSLVRFAIFQSEGGPVPDGATIQSATLSLYKHSNYHYTYRAHRLLQDWHESEASWNERQAGVSWSVAGADDFGTDLELVADGEASIDFDPGWLALDVTLGLQAISGGVTNYGWRLVAVSGYNSLPKRFRSREYADDATLRPKLVITYSTD